MTENKQTIEKYIEGFNTLNHQQILECLTDDIIWEMPGFFHLEGKVAFDGEIENSAFTGKPVVTLMRMVEEDDVVVAEGSVKSMKADGTPFAAQFCDIFEMENTKIKKLSGYLHEIKTL